MNAGPPADDSAFVERALEAAIRIGLVFLLISWCFTIVRPFVIPIVWGIIIAVAAYPGYQWLQEKFRCRSTPAAILFTLFMLLIVIAPTLMLSGTLVETVRLLAEDLTVHGTLTIPPPSESVHHWPLVGEPLYSFWNLASENIQAALKQIGPQIRVVGKWLLATAAGAGFGILQFVFAIIIAGVLMPYAKGGDRIAHAIAARLAGKQRTDLVELVKKTIRSVASGILGVALIQSLLAGLGFMVAGVPAAGFWALLCLLLGVAQIGIIVVLVPVIIYLFNTADTVTAVSFLVWSIPVGLIDNILKPILLARGLKTPMVIIFMGAIGGFLSSGIIGLFVGAVLLSLSYELFMLWLGDAPTNGQNQGPGQLSPADDSSGSAS
ncbi:MAG TPA: AI-2E family transporter [Gammaproteobacteria bacterium]|nr:AI-2E family transporter [Gammaproteobacteria bacterium]